jgi:hypothetical protein
MKNFSFHAYHELSMHHIGLFLYLQNYNQEPFSPYRLNCTFLN